MIKKLTLLAFFIGSGVIFNSAKAQSLTELDSLKQEIEILKLSELVQSMCQRSLLLPSYFSELKALIAKQAYNFWKENRGEKYVSHLNIYSALYYANKELNRDNADYGFDFIKDPIAYNQAVGHDENVTAIKFDKDPNIFYSAGSDGRVIRWNLNDIKKVPEVIYQGNHLISSIDVSFDNRYLMIVSKEKGVIMMDIQNKDENGNYLLANDPEPVQAAVFLPKELKYISVNKKGKVTEKGFSLQKREIGESINSKILSLVIKEDDNKIFAGTEEGLVHIWKDTTHSLLYSQYIRAINSLSISHDLTYLAIGDEFGEAILWDIVNKEVVRRISGHSSAITKVEFSPDDKKLLTASRDGTVRIWDMNDTKKLPLVLDDHEGWVMTAGFSPDGNKILTGSSDKFIRVFSSEPDALAERICELVSRNLTIEEWQEYVGAEIPYQKTCENQ